MIFAYCYRYCYIYEIHEIWFLFISLLRLFFRENYDTSYHRKRRDIGEISRGVGPKLMLYVLSYPAVLSLFFFVDFRAVSLVLTCSILSRL